MSLGGVVGSSLGGVVGSSSPITPKNSTGEPI